MKPKPNPQLSHPNSKHRDGTVQLNIDVDPEIRKAVKIRAAELGLQMKDLAGILFEYTMRHPEVINAAIIAAAIRRK